MERETNRKKTRYNNSPEQKKDYICLAMAVIASTEKKKKELDRNFITIHRT